MEDQNFRAMDICIVAHYAYGALRGGHSGHIGGVEHQTSMMARWLARRGHRVTMVVWDEGQADGELIDDVRIVKLCRRDSGVPLLRFLWPRWTSLVRALRVADAEVYYQNCGEYVTGQVAAWCRHRHRPFVYSVALDSDCDSELPTMRSFRERILYRYGLRRADRVVVQTMTQKSMLKDGFDVESTVIPMPCAGPDAEHYSSPNAELQRAKPVLWVGRVCRQKRPDRLLELARMCPAFAFDLVGPPSEGVTSQEVLDAAEALPNVTVHGAVSRARMAEFYSGASCLCCTSDFEGFPNTFLEAWSHGIPIVSTFDPDGLIRRHELGETACDAQTLKAALERLLGANERWQVASNNARRYYVENHTVRAVLPQFERVFLEARSTLPVA